MKVEIFGEHNCISKLNIEKIINDFCNSFRLVDHKSLEIQFVSAAEMRKINFKYINIDQATDVLSFPQAKGKEFKHSFGTIIICQDKAKEYNEKCEELIKHGLLHLAGFDHERDIINWQSAANTINHSMEATINE